jgi:pimeloyl-ACP methyl ester carboxylesterase
LLERGDTAIYYEERGEGFPLLLIAPGGMRSTIDRWSAAAIDPWEAYSGDFRLIAMDQRNAGRSRGPLEAGDPWGAYAADQLGLLDSLGVDRFMVMGCCIGGSYVLKLTEVAPDRVVAGVLEQPIGVQEDNAEIFAELQRSWAEELVAGRPELEIGTVEQFLGAMWRDGFVVSVGVESVEACPVPLLVLPGIDEYHPTRTGREIAALAPHAELFEPWKDSPEHVAEATEAVRRFLIQRAQGAA